MFLVSVFLQVPDGLLGVLVVLMVLFNDLPDFGYDFLAFEFSLGFVGSETETDGSDGFFLGFEFVESVFIFFLDFGVADNVEEDLYDEVVVGVLYFGLGVGHFGDVDELNALDVHGFDDGIEFEKFFD